MTKIISRNFRVLCDFMDVYQFMIEVYEKDWRNGVPAPFLEYALSSIAYSKFMWKIISQAHPFCMSNDILPDVR